MLIESWTAEINKRVLMELPAIKGMSRSVSFISSLAVFLRRSTGISVSTL